MILKHTIKKSSLFQSSFKYEFLSMKNPKEIVFTINSNMKILLII